MPPVPDVVVPTSTDMEPATPEEATPDVITMMPTLPGFVVPDDGKQHTVILCNCIDELDININVQCVWVWKCDVITDGNQQRLDNLNGVSVEHE